MTTFRPIPATVALAALALAAAGCSSSPTPRPATSPHTLGQGATTIGGAPSTRRTDPATSNAPAAAPTIPDACTLLTNGEARAIAGVPLESGQDTKAAQATDVASCTYNAPPTGTSGSITISVQLQVPDALTTDRSLGHPFHTVPGIADQALEEENNIFVRKGPLWLTISSAYPATAAHLKSGARVAVSRLG